MAETAQNLSQEIDLTPVKPQVSAGELVVRDESEFSMLFDTAKFNQAYRAAVAFSKSKLVPVHFQGAPEACFVALHMAVRMNLDPMMVMQKTYIVQGRPGMEAQLVIALVNARGPFKGPIQWRVEGQGDNRQWTAYATHKETGELCEATVTWTMVKAEGWSTKAGSKWMTIPDLMGRYRSAVFLARLYCPEVIMGLSTVDELQDMPEDVIEAEIVPALGESKSNRTNTVKSKLKALKGAEKTDSPQSGQSPSPSPETTTGGGTEPPGAITQEQQEYLDKAPLDLVEAAYDACGVDRKYPVAELDFVTAEKLVDWLKAK